MVDCSKFKRVGEDVYVSQNTEIKRPHLVKLGNHIAIDSYFYCTTALSLGDYIHIAPFVSCIGGEDGLFTMGNFTTIAAGSRIICRGDAHMGAGLVSPVIPIEYRDDVVGSEIFMDDFSSIGTNVVLMPNVWLAEGVVVGANSLVTKPIEEPWSVWIGSPARKVKNRPKERMLDFARRMGYGY